MLTNSLYKGDFERQRQVEAVFLNAWYHTQPFSAIRFCNETYTNFHSILMCESSSVMMFTLAVMWSYLYRVITIQYMGELMRKSSNDQAARALALLAHEVRSPLSVIVTASYLMKMSQNATQKDRDYCELILRQARQIDETADTIIDLSRIKLGKDPAPSEGFLLCELINEAVETCSSLFERHSVDIDLDLPREYTPVSGSKSLFRQAIVNLLTNAVKFSPPYTKVHVRVRPTKRRVVISVKDQGKGLDPEERRSIFKIYSQSKARSNGTGQGLGLGLYIVRRIARIHRGGVSVISDGRGLGCEFRLWLPI